MFNGPGKYDDVLTVARASMRARSAILISLGGPLGSGFDVQATLPDLLLLPSMLRQMADQIEEQQRATMEAILREGGDAGSEKG